MFNIEFLDLIAMPAGAVMLYEIHIVPRLAISLGGFRIVENTNRAVIPDDHPHFHFWYFHRRPVGQVMSACRAWPGVGSTPLARQGSIARDIGARMGEYDLAGTTTGVRGGGRLGVIVRACRCGTARSAANTCVATNTQNRIMLQPNMNLCVLIVISSSPRLGLRSL